MMYCRTHSNPLLCVRGCLLKESAGLACWVPLDVAQVVSCASKSDVSFIWALQLVFQMPFLRGIPLRPELQQQGTWCLLKLVPWRGAQKQRGPARPQKAASMPAVCPSRWGCQHQLRHCELHCWAPGRSCWPPQIPGANFSRVWL
eukprot:scaffold124507_cov17-Tisochrysis_lutea.AAC.1